jgi:hypothetical protein
LLESKYERWSFLTKGKLICRLLAFVELLQDDCKEEDEDDDKEEAHGRSIPLTNCL